MATNRTADIARIIAAADFTDRLKALRYEAHHDAEMATICDRALAGDEQAKRDAADVMRDCEAQQSYRDAEMAR